MEKKRRYRKRKLWPGCRATFRTAFSFFHSVSAAVTDQLEKGQAGRRKTGLPGLDNTRMNIRMAGNKPHRNDARIPPVSGSARQVEKSGKRCGECTLSACQYARPVLAEKAVCRTWSHEGRGRPLQRCIRRNRGLGMVVLPDHRRAKASATLLPGRSGMTSGMYTGSSRQVEKTRETENRRPFPKHPFPLRFKG